MVLFSPIRQENIHKKEKAGQPRAKSLTLSKSHPEPPNPAK
jgi:hypothetical protein